VLGGDLVVVDCEALLGIAAGEVDATRALAFRRPASGLGSSLSSIASAAGSSGIAGDSSGL
jgi:hypothetical protein